MCNDANETEMTNDKKFQFRYPENHSTQPENMFVVYFLCKMRGRKRSETREISYFGRGCSR